MQQSKRKSVYIWLLKDICKSGGFLEVFLYVPEMTSLSRFAVKNILSNHHSECGKSCPIKFRLQNQKIYEKFETARFQKQRKNKISEIAENYRIYILLILYSNIKSYL